MSELTIISKTMSYILRHSDIKTDEYGFISIDSLLNNQKLKKYNISFDIIKYIVDNDNKNRYKLSDDNKFIRANQGHSKHKEIDIGTKDEKSKEIDSDILFAYHGTSIKNSDKIIKFGLSRMNRLDIHMVENKENVLYYSQVIIKIDIQKAKALGIIFVKSLNNYILSRGDSNNIIPPECLSIEYINK
jgi:RNA:NAD 2'-phosphotransferase (TPT1/KptA family)